MRQMLFIAAAAVMLAAAGCVSRTTTTQRGFGEDVTEKRMIWIWEKEFRNPKP